MKRTHYIQTHKWQKGVNYHGRLIPICQKLRMITCENDEIKIEHEWDKLLFIISQFLPILRNVS